MLILLLLFLRTVNSCGPNCENCNSLFCIACSNGFELNIDGSCYNSSSIPYCSVFLTEKNCSSCQPTYSLSSNGNCLKDYSGCIQHDQFSGDCILCQFGKFLSNGKCQGTLNCANYNGTICINCTNNYIYNGSICIWNGKGCASVDRDTGSCSSCVNGYKLVGYQCVDNNKLINNCYLSITQTQCLACKTGYLTNPQKLCILPPNSICLEFDSQQNCIICNSTKLTKKNGICIDTHCKSGPVGNCKQCLQGFVIKNSSVCQLNDPRCLVFTDDGSQCLQCQIGYFITANRTCHKLSQNCLAADIITFKCIHCAGSLVLIGGACSKPIVVPNCALMSASQTCLICSQGYYLLNNICNKVSSLCNGYDPVYGLCLNCKVGYINQGGLCVDVNCMTRDGDLCTQCKPNFVRQSSGLCYFSDPNCAQATTINCLACKPGYYSNSGLCVQFPPNCMSVNSDGSCAACFQKYKLYSMSCIIPVPYCSNYSVGVNFTQCLSCEIGFNLVGGNCLQMIETDPNCISVKNGVCVQCSNRFYFQNGKCIPVNPTCKSFAADTGMCTDCYPGYMLFNGTCPPAPPKDPNCKTVTPQGCIECYQSFFLKSGSCAQISSLCKTSNNLTGQCFSCYSGYSLFQGTCSSAYADPNCARYDLNGSCLACSEKYYKRSGLCTRVSPLCKTYNVTTGNCLSCYPGYYLAGGACWAGNDPNLDPNCNLRSLNGSCLQCASSYYLATSGYCMAANLLCRTFNTSNGYCLTCYAGYIIKNNSCVLASSTTSDPNCLRFGSNGQCQECYVSFFVSSGVCKLINQLCRTTNYSDGSCLSCYPGYSLNQGNCAIPNLYAAQALDPYCSVFQNSKCIKCQNGYYVQGTSCSLIDPQCQNFDVLGGKCINCYMGYQLTDTGGCLLQAQNVIAFCSILSPDGINCKQCMQGYYNSAPNICSAVSILCLTYDENTGACLSCRAGYFFQGGSCVYPAMGLDSNCLSYDISAYCSTCKPGFYLLNYICSKIDPNCVTFDILSQQCQVCGNGKTARGSGCV